MTTRRVLITYGTSYGQTALIAGRIRNVLTERGQLVTVRRADQLPADHHLADYDAVVVGASMIRHGYQKYVSTFVRRHAGVLDTMPSAFFAVSRAAGSRDPAERATAQRLAAEFCAATGWQPAIVESVAGAIAYTRYNVVLRWIMKRISAREGGSTDTSRDHEYTDWAQVDRFARRFADALAEPAHAFEPAESGGGRPAR